MNPGTIVEIEPKSVFQTDVDVILASSPKELLENLASGIFVQKKAIPAGELGFVVSKLGNIDSRFSWLIEVSFPNINTQGWVDIAEIKTRRISSNR